MHGVNKRISPTGKISGWPAQNMRYTSAVQGPTPLTAVKWAIASEVSIWQTLADRAARKLGVAIASKVEALARERPTSNRPSAPSAITPGPAHVATQLCASRPKIADADALETICDTTISASPEKPAGCSRSGTGPHAQ